MINLIKLDKAIKEHKIVEHIKDGIADGLLHGERDDTKTHHYYKIGYDYGLTMYERVMENEKGADLWYILNYFQVVV